MSMNEWLIKIIHSVLFQLTLLIIWMEGLLLLFIITLHLFSISYSFINTKQKSFQKVPKTIHYYDYFKKNKDGEKKDIGRLWKNIIFPGIDDIHERQPWAAWFDSTRFIILSLYIYLSIYCRYLCRICGYQRTT